MSTDESTPDIHPFELPDWGEEGAPPAPSLDEQVSTRPREIELAIDTEPVIATTPVTGERASVIGLVTAEGSAKHDGTDLEQAAGVAVQAALDRLRDALAASGGTDVYGVRISLATGKKRVVALVYGTAISRRT